MVPGEGQMSLLFKAPLQQQVGRALWVELFSNVSLTYDLAVPRSDAENPECLRTKW